MIRIVLLAVIRIAPPSTFSWVHLRRGMGQLRKHLFTESQLCRYSARDTVQIDEPFAVVGPDVPWGFIGLANVELPLAMLLYHFDWKLPNGLKHEDLDITERFGGTVRRKKDLCLIPIPYHPNTVS
ncbi:cytochrome P450 71AV8-like [Pistacia vera]|uniref:cytochrome P450 71AV8-like n=1 Tax=Pistacia vera TaxID=55513 RepID=UPI001263DDDE|nr:cytochrome P450 71AV8-like [Pistacia vera]